MAASADEGAFVFINRMAGYVVKPTLERPRDDACERLFLARQATARRALQTLHLCLFGHFEGVIYLNTEVSDRAFELRVPKQQLYRPKMPCPPVGQRCLRASHGVRAVSRVVEPD